MLGPNRVTLQLARYSLAFFGYRNTCKLTCCAQTPTLLVHQSDQTLQLNLVCLLMCAFFSLVYRTEHAANICQPLSPWLSLYPHSFCSKIFAVLQLSKPQPLQRPPLPIDTFVSLEVGGGEVRLELAATHCKEQPVLLLACVRHAMSCMFCMLSVCCSKNMFGSMRCSCVSQSLLPCMCRW